MLFHASPSRYLDKGRLANQAAVVPATSNGHAQPTRQCTVFAHHLSGPTARPVTSRFPERVEMRLKLRADPVEQVADAFVVLL